MANVCREEKERKEQEKRKGERMNPMESLSSDMTGALKSHINEI
jgi:hypothetical protein